MNDIYLSPLPDLPPQGEGQEGGVNTHFITLDRA